MPLPLAVIVNRADLRLVVAGIVAMMPGMAVETVPRWLHNAVLALLRPAESSLRRLIAIAATMVEVEPQKQRKASSGRTSKKKKSKRKALPAVFGLFDSRLRVDPKPATAPGYGPNVRFLDDEDAMPPQSMPVLPDDPVSAAALCRRLAALCGALADIPGQAERLAKMLARGTSRWPRVMRPGRPPGHREGGRRPVDILLADCHEMALRALAEVDAPDTS